MKIPFTTLVRYLSKRLLTSALRQSTKCPIFLLCRFLPSFFFLSFSFSSSSFLPNCIMRDGLANHCTTSRLLLPSCIHLISFVHSFVHSFLLSFFPSLFRCFFLTTTAIFTFLLLFLIYSFLYSFFPLLFVRSFLPSFFLSLLLFIDSFLYYFFFDECCLFILNEISCPIFTEVTTEVD
ncbi:unnamed protein product [Acanthosepion pharaonis]|uniref:Uncharacterized protein n=1 Tax=Acanthosepion pharaonis TaxID=158019 RepID=A0A812EII8_ACAPH|nr:unnamed protein product [Sepia pharaonis]